MSIATRTPPLSFPIRRIAPPARVVHVAPVAPIFDFDAQVEVLGTEGGVSVLVIPPMKPRVCRRIVRRLARCGFADPDWARALIGSTHAPAGGGPTLLELTVPLHAEPGVVAGHTDVFVDRPMSFAEASRLAHALGCLVDAQQTARARRRHEWRTRALS